MILASMQYAISMLNVCLVMNTEILNNEVLMPF